jgi:hypothetical protein
MKRMLKIEKLELYHYVNEVRIAQQLQPTLWEL